MHNLCKMLNLGVNQQSVNILYTLWGEVCVVSIIMLRSCYTEQALAVTNSGSLILGFY